MSRSLDLSELKAKSDKFSVFNPGYTSTTPPEDNVPRPLSVVSIPLEETGSMDFAFFPKHDSKENGSQPDLSQSIVNSLEKARLDDLVEGELWNVANIPGQISFKAKIETKQEQKETCEKVRCRAATPPFSLALGVRQSLERRSSKELHSRPVPVGLPDTEEVNPVLRRVHRSESTPGIIMGSSPKLHQRLSQNSDLPALPSNHTQSGLAGNGAGTKVFNLGRPQSAIELVWVPKDEEKEAKSLSLPPHLSGLAATDKQLSQSCEALVNGQKKSKSDKQAKRRCPTPPRVLSPNTVQYEFLADV